MEKKILGSPRQTSPSGERPRGVGYRPHGGSSVGGYPTPSRPFAAHRLDHISNQRFLAPPLTGQKANLKRKKVKTVQIFVNLGLL